jgi:hypothetical protein
MNANPLRRRALMLALALLAACTAGGQNGSSPTPRARTTVHVQNTAFIAYTVYVQAGVGDRRRLGTVQPVSSQDFVIPPGMVVGTTQLRFIADPIGSDAIATSYNLAVNEGDRLELTIN